uniref:Uncharacterized protein n=1 Tax=Mycena chlorophos TaxID=658473 RepID=A0ABQ0LJM2_MYCCL|nr:predicted protein [Mycena chlorophos]
MDTRSQSFTLASSPPLILALLAVGVCVAGMMGFALLRTWRERNAPTFVPLPPAAPPPARPELWDVWCPVHGDGQTVCRWSALQPLSATTWDFSPPTQNPPTDVQPQPPAISTRAPRRSQLRKQIFSFRRRGTDNTEAEMQSTKMSTLSMVRLQVAVAIAMPQAGDGEREELDYAIGSFERPWNK